MNDLSTTKLEVFEIALRSLGVGEEFIKQYVPRHSVVDLQAIPEIRSRVKTPQKGDHVFSVLYNSTSSFLYVVHQIGPKKANVRGCYKVGTNGKGSMYITSTYGSRISSDYLRDACIIVPPDLVQKALHVLASSHKVLACAGFAINAVYTTWGKTYMLANLVTFLEDESKKGD